MNKKPCTGYIRPDQLTYGPGPKYRNIPLPPPPAPRCVRQEHDKSIDNNAQNKHCKPGVIPPPPFMPLCPPNCRPIPPCPKDCKDFRPPMNHREHRQKYFYTILFLDNYYSQPEKNDPIIPPERPNGGKLKSWDISEDTETTNIHWLQDNRLYVRHNLQMPITVEMWDNQKNVIVYCPILKDGVANVTLGDVQVDSPYAIIINFDTDKKPKYNQVFHLAIRSLPDFALTAEEDDVANTPLQNLIKVPKCKKGLALIFRRNSLDGLYDLISEFDDTYYHSLDDSADLQYLTDKSCYKDVHFVTKYTNNLQDILDLIDLNYYNIQYSWQDHKKYQDF